MSSSLYKLQRRTFLTALGLGVSASLSMKMAKLAVAQPAARPKRLLIVFLPHGQPVEHFDPVTDGGVFNLKAKGIGGLSSLEPYKDYVTMVRGIGLADGAANHVAIKSVLTGPADGSVDSINYTIAKALGTTPFAIGAQPYIKENGFNEDSHLIKHGGAWVRPIEKPADTVAELFAGVGGTVGPDESAFQNEAAGLTEKQLDRLTKRVAGLSTEESKLRIHLGALQALKGGGDTGIKGCTTKPSLPAVDAAASLDPMKPDNFAAIFDAQLEAIANAMVCGTARVTVLQILLVNATIRMNFPGGPGLALEHHLGLSHQGFERTTYAQGQSWFYQRVAEKLLKVLMQQDPADPAHKVIDNSLVYFTTEVSDGGNHNSDASPETYVFSRRMYTYLPQLLIGGAGGYLKPGGRAVKVTDNRPHTDMLGTLADAMGVPVPSIGKLPVNLIQELKA